MDIVRGDFALLPYNISDSTTIQELRICDQLAMNSAYHCLISRYILYSQRRMAVGIELWDPFILPHIVCTI